MKIGLKSSLLPRFFPINRSAEFQSCSLASWRHFWGTVDVILEEAASCCEEQNGHSGVRTSLRTCKSREVTSTEEEKHCKVGPAQGDSWGSRVAPGTGPAWGAGEAEVRERSLSLQRSAASSLLPGLSSQENNMKKHGTDSVLPRPATLGLG